MKRLLNRKGFTMVELIVVVGMIAIMLGILIPILSTADARENEAKEYARSFYSNVQELMIDEKLAKTTEGTPLEGQYLLVCAHVTKNDTAYEDIEIYMSYASAPTGFSTLTELSGTTNADPYEDFGEFVTSLRRMLLGNDRDGYFYAVVDKKYRVVSAYFTYAGTDSETVDIAFGLVNDEEFTDDCRVGSNNLLTGAYPDSLCVKGSKMFQLPA